MFLLPPLLANWNGQAVTYEGTKIFIPNWGRATDEEREPWSYIKIISHRTGVRYARKVSQWGFKAVLGSMQTADSGIFI